MGIFHNLILFHLAPTALNYSYHQFITRNGRCPAIMIIFLQETNLIVINLLCMKSHIYINAASEICSRFLFYRLIHS